MPLDLIIDGYNLLHFAGLARARYGPGDLERARERLLKRVRDGLTADERSRTTIVFDAQNAPHADRRESRPHGMLVMYSPLDREADDTIEDLLEAHPSPRQVLVVSSDNRLHRSARSVRAHAMTSEAFLQQLEERPRTHSEEANRAGDDEAGAAPVSSPDLSAEFADLDVDAIVREVQQERQPESRPTSPAPSPATPPPSSTRTPAPTPEARPQRPSVRKPRPGQPSPLPDQPLPDRIQPDLPELHSSELDFWEQRISELLDED